MKLPKGNITFRFDYPVPNTASPLQKQSRALATSEKPKDDKEKKGDDKKDGKEAEAEDKVMVKKKDKK